MHHKGLWPLTKSANRGFGGYPVATIAFYGFDDRRASKVAVDIVPAEGAEAADIARWFSDGGRVLYGHAPGEAGRCASAAAFPERAAYLYRWDLGASRGVLTPLVCP